jgi:hypothetical protein
VGRTGADCQPYLLAKADASQIPLKDNSVSLVIATPPNLGVKRRRKRDYCTSDQEEYALLMTKFLKEAIRILKPRRHILLISSLPGRRKSKGARRVVFHVLQKRVSRYRWTHVRIKSETFLTHYVEVRNFPWWALSVWLYRNLIRRYSEPGEIVAHIFSGSGNGGIAALELARKPVLIDLHYQRQTRWRLDDRIRGIRPKINSSFFDLSA